MASLPPIRKLYIEDYASQKSWIGPFLIVMNTFMTAVVTALTKNITLADNTTSDVRTVTLSTVPTAAAPTSLAWIKPVAPLAVIVGNTRRSNGAVVTLSAAVQVQWQMSTSNTSIQITNVVGITPTADTQYLLTLICIAG